MIKITILHISPDEKFVDMGLQVFEEAYPQNNKLILVTNTDKIKYVTFKSHTLLSKKELTKRSKENSFWEEIDTVIFHSLFVYSLIIPVGIKVIWIGFGYDYYDYIYTSKQDYFGNKTKKLSKNINIKDKCKALLGFNKYREKKKSQFIERVDIFCPVLNDEYYAIKWPAKRKPILMDWNYGTMEGNWGKKSNTSLCGNNILLGNSANLTCNHIEGIDLIASRSDIDGHLVLPLSYGNKRYGQVVKRYAQKNFHGEVIVLEDFLPFESYIEVISSCSFVIMPHKRQQGLGNIVMLMNLGAKVFLDKDNLLYNFLKVKGFFIFTLEDISGPDFQVKLTNIQIVRNQKLLYEIWGVNSILSKTRKLIECELAN